MTDSLEKNKIRGERRKKNYAKALRKKKVLHDVDNTERKARNGEYRSLHWYSKGRIYHSWYGSRVRTKKRNSVVCEPPKRDKRKILTMTEDINGEL